MIFFFSKKVSYTEVKRRQDLIIADALIFLEVSIVEYGIRLVYFSGLITEINFLFWALLAGSHQ